MVVIVCLPLKDTAGEEKYASLSSFYCRGAQVAILAFDLTNQKSLDKLKELFIPLLEDSAGSCLTVVVGTKVDLAKDGRQVPTFRPYVHIVYKHETVSHFTVHVH